MKKVLFLMTCLALIIGISFACADGFTLHSGVTFDMTVDEMIATERAKGYEPTQVTNGKISMGVSGKEEYNLSQYSAVYEVKGSFVSGVANTLYYFFDKNGLLCQMIYPCGSTYRALSYVDEVIAPLSSLYCDKYGDPLKNAVTFAKTKDARNLMSNHRPDSFWKYKYTNAGDVIQWAIPYGDAMIADIVIQPIKQDMSKINMVGYTFIIGYTRVTKAEYDESVADAEEADQQMVQQFMDDI